DDIRQLGDRGQVDCICGGFPCQSFSIAGRRGGFDDTRGTLFFEIVRFADILRPQYLFLENVKGLVGHDKGKTLDTIVKTINDIGYRVDFEVLNSKYFGVPQNRERIFILAVRDDLIDNEPWNNTKGTTVVPKGKRRISGYDDVKTFNFDWPKHEEVTTKLRDMLEPEVDEKYYLPDDKTAKLVAQMEDKDKRTGTVGHHPFSKSYEIKGYNSEISPSIIATDYKAPKTTLELGPHNLGHVDIKNNDFVKRVYSPYGINPTLTTMGGGHREPKIAEEQETILEEVRPVLTPDRVEKRQNGRRFKEDGEEMFTLTSQDRHGIAIKEATKKGYAIAEEGDSINVQFPDSKTRRGRVGKQIAN